MKILVEKKEHVQLVGEVLALRGSLKAEREKADGLTQRVGELAVQLKHEKEVNEAMLVGVGKYKGRGDRLKRWMVAGWIAAGLLAVAGLALVLFS